MGASPLHASTVGLIRNLRTNHISPQFHMVYDDFFQTVHATALEAPASWADLFTLSWFKSDYDDKDFVPTLPDEWLTPIELNQRQHQEQVQRSQDGPSSADATHIPEPDDEMQPQRAPPEASQRAPSEVVAPVSEALPPLAVLRGRCQSLSHPSRCLVTHLHLPAGILLAPVEPLFATTNMATQW
jgi:hypothetical protein